MDGSGQPPNPPPCLGAGIVGLPRSAVSWNRRLCWSQPEAQSCPDVPGEHPTAGSKRRISRSGSDSKCMASPYLNLACVTKQMNPAKRASRDFSSVHATVSSTDNCAIENVAAFLYYRLHRPVSHKSPADSLRTQNLVNISHKHSFAKSNCFKKTMSSGARSFEISQLRNVIVHVNFTEGKIKAVAEKGNWKLAIS